MSESNAVEKSIESAQTETRLFPPPAAASAKAYIKSMDDYQSKWKQSIDSPETFWPPIANELDWSKPWSKVLDWQVPNAKWFVNGKTNLAVNCVDRHIRQGRGDKVAILFEGELEIAPGQGGEVRKITYNQLAEQVNQFANALKAKGVKKGDRVTIYLPLVPEALVAMLACARIGAVHSVIFGGFSSQAIADRVKDAQSAVLITADGGSRRGQVVPLKENVDAALKTTDVVKNRHRPQMHQRKPGNGAGPGCLVA